MSEQNAEFASKEQGSGPQSLLAGLLEAARRRNLSANSLLAYRRTWTQFAAWASVSDFDPRSLPAAAAQEAYGWLGEKKGAAAIKQIRAALAFAYKHWDLKNPFARIEPPIQNEPQIRYLMLADIRRLLAHLKAQQESYGSQLAFHLANGLFQTACRFDELIQLQWADCQRVGDRVSGCARASIAKRGAAGMAGGAGHL